MFTDPCKQNPGSRRHETGTISTCAYSRRPYTERSSLSSAVAKLQRNQEAPLGELIQVQERRKV